MKTYCKIKNYYNHKSIYQLKNHESIISLNYMKKYGNNKSIISYIYR